MIISCVKWGDKFSHEHVNRLYKMVCKNMQDEFTFVCHTENPDGIHPNIQIIPLDLSLGLETWWWKLTLFQQSTNEVNIFFDLDNVIQKDITHLKDYAEEDKLMLIKAYWKPWLEGVEAKVDKGFDMNLNSSVLIWKGDLTEIWNMFIEDPELYLFKYRGIDSYINFHHNEKLNYLPRGEVYSRLYGIDEDEHWYTYGKDLPEKYYYSEDHTICIFNGWRRKHYYGKPENGYMLDDEQYEGFEHYWS